MRPAAVAPLMSSDEVNLLVYAYLAESCLDHSAFTLYSESHLAEFLESNDENPPSVPPTGHLIRILQKGLLYLQAEAKYRGDDVSSHPPRLIGYEIPENLPLPALPKSLPAPSPPPTASDKGSTSAAPVLALQPPKRKQSTNASVQSINNASGSNSNLKRKESSRSNGDVGQLSSGATVDESATQAQPKKQRMATRSPPLPVSDATKADRRELVQSSVTGDNQDAVNKDSRTSKTDEEEEVKSRKGKGRASDADVEIEATLESSSITARKFVSSDENSKIKTDKKSIPSPSTSVRPILPPLPHKSASKSEDASSTPIQRRSTSPVTATAKKPQSGGVSSAKERTRTRSASPNTTLRSVSGTSQASAGTSRQASISAHTPTTDSSKAAVSPTVSKPPPSAADQTAPSHTDIEQLHPIHVIKKEEVTILKGHTMPVQPCHWNPKVETLLATGSGDSSMRIWDVPRDVPPSAITENIICKHSSGQRRSDVTAVEWNKDGSLLASGSEDGIARIWTPSGDLHLVLSMHQRTIFCVKWNNTGSMLLTGSLDHSVCLWDTGYGKVKQQWSSHADSILDLDWMTDDVFASCSMDKMINLHQAGRNTPVYRFKGHADEVNCIRFCPNNRMLASCSDDNTVRVWSLQPIKRILGFVNDEEAKKEPQDEGDGAGCIDRSYDTQDRPFTILRGHEKEVHAVAWCPRAGPGTKLLASASFDGTARIWDALSGTCQHIFSRHTDMVYSLAWQPDIGEYLATGSNDKKMCVLRVPNGKLGSTSNGGENEGSKRHELVLEYEHPGPIYEICWHPTRSQIAVCGKHETVNVVNFSL